MLGNLGVTGISLPPPSRPLLPLMSAHGGVIWEFQSDVLGWKVKFTIGIINSQEIFYTILLHARSQRHVSLTGLSCQGGTGSQSSPPPRPPFPTQTETA